MPFVDVPQHSHEWFDARLGRCTASMVIDAVSFLKRGAGKGGPTAARTNYLTRLVAERLTGLATDTYVSPAMQWGIDTEKHARAAYEVVSDNSVDLCGVCLHDSIENFAASPDGTIGEDGLVELKCPTSPKHLEYRLAGEIPEIYLPQCIAQLACTGRKWVDFVSFDPRFPPRLQVFIKRLERDEKQIAALEYGVIEFLAEVEGKVRELGGSVEDTSLPALGSGLKDKLRRSIEQEDVALILDEDIAWIQAKHAEPTV